MLHKLLEDTMRGQSNSMAMTLKFITQGYERLYVTTASNNLDYDVERNVPLHAAVGSSINFDWYQAIFNMCRHKLAKRSSEPRINFYVNSSI